jgi:hypothetical protein
LASLEYEPRSAATTVLYQIVRDHFETFRAQAAQLSDGEGLPTFVERAFNTFLKCGWLAGGFARFHCRACGLDRLVAFSCKGRALYCWAIYLRVLRRWLEHGERVPYEQRLDV